MQANDFSEAFKRLGEFLADSDVRIRIVIVGGAALNLLGLVDRTTRDADVIAMDAEGKLVPPTLPPEFLEGVRLVADSMGLAPDWLNTGPASQLGAGLPDGFYDRLAWRSFATLDVGIASRTDLISLKLFAAADHWPARTAHYHDLLALHPGPDELHWARDWVVTQDASAEFTRLTDDLVGNLLEHAE